MNERGKAVLSIGGVLVVVVPAVLDDAAVVSLQEDLSFRVADKGARGVVIDLSAVDVVDTFVGRRLSLIASVAGMLGARPVLVGVRPTVAQTVVRLGVGLDDMTTVRDLDAGLKLLGAR
ncbi:MULTISPECIES: STAS domain-containing protein [unclassified Streptomyces]|uniref:STAS domain-containing protein n=1 Tax=unclassified Streptomyces TaxID=2593676 RepID=UPI0033B7D726